MRDFAKDIFAKKAALAGLRKCRGAADSAKHLPELIRERIVASGSLNSRESPFAVAQAVTLLINTTPQKNSAI
jgi:hypothetical protein